MSGKECFPTQKSFDTSHPLPHPSPPLSSIRIRSASFSFSLSIPLFFFFFFKHTHPLPPTYTGLFSLASSFSRMEMLLLLPDGAGLQECLLFHCNTLFPAHRAVIIAIRPVCPNLATRERTVCVCKTACGVG